MKKYILEYYAGDPDTMSEYDDTTDKYIRSWYYDSSPGISFGWFQTSLDGGKEFVAGEDICHYDLTQEIGRKILGKAVNCQDFEDDDIESVGHAINNTSAFKGRTFDIPKVITTWHKVSSKKLYEIVEKLGGVEKFQNYEYVFPKEYPYGGNEEAEAGHMNVIDYINSHDKYVCAGDMKRMEMDIKGSYSFPEWMVDIVREYNAPNTKLADKTAKLGNMTIAQYNSLIHQEGKEGKETINEYFGGNPDTLTRYDYSKRDSGLLGKIGGFINKLANKRGFTPQHIRQEYYYDEGNTITFGYFQDSIDAPKIFKKTENGTHLDIVRTCTESYIRNAKSRIGRDGYNKVHEAIMNTSACKGRVFLKPKVITTWGVVTSARLKEIVGLLGIENPQEYYYVVDRKECNLLKYINSNYGKSSGDGDESRFDIKIEDINDRKLQGYLLIIKDYNSPSSKLVDKSRKLGNMTIAQYNSLIHQEEKEPKDTIKENNMKENKYQKEFSNYIEIMNEALKRNDFKAYNVAKSMLEETIEDSKQEEALLAEMDTSNFGILNHIFEQQLPTLIKSNKKAVRDVIKTIKEDKNLLGQFNFYNVVKNQYKGDTANLVEAKEALEKLAEISVKGIDQKTVKESNKKLRKVMLENNVIPTEFVDEENKTLYESGHVILTRKKTTANMIPLIESYHNVCQYMENHKNDAVKESKNPDELIREFEEKMKTNLNESEISFVQQITDFRTPIAEQRKEKLFNKFKNECLEKINSMLKEDAENSGLIDLSKQINEMTFDKNNIVKDIAKLLEIRDILMDD